MSGDTITVHCLFDALVDPNTLIPHPRNPNQHPDKQIKALCASVRRHGWRHCVTVSRLSGRVVAGHARRLAAMALGIQCPVVYQSFDSETEELAFVVADNRLAELAVIDTVLLDSAVEALAAAGADMLAVGFEDYRGPDGGIEPPGEVELVRTKPYNEMLVSVTTTFETWELKLKDIFSDVEKIEGVKVVYGGKD